MKNKPNNQSQVRITNKKTGKERLSALMPVYNSKQQQDAVSEESVVASITEPVTKDPTPSVLSEIEVVSIPHTPEISSPVAEPSDSGVSKSKGKSKGTVGSNPKADIKTLEQFITYAFSRKGQRINLSSKVTQLINQDARLDEMAMKRLSTVADTDVQLAVLRQLLLFAREVGGFPALEKSIVNFVLTTMQRHPVFSHTDVRAVVLHKLSDAPLEAALKRVAGYEPSLVPGQNKLKPTELQALRQNAMQLLAVWLATNNNLNAEALSKLLLEAVWVPAARELVDNNAHLRALTEIEQAAGVGFACEKLLQNAKNADSAKNQAEQKAAVLSESLEKLQLQLQQTERERDALAAELNAIKVSSANELAQAQKQHEDERKHLQNDQEQLRGRLVRRLSDSIDMLEVGLTALRNKTPRTEVMAERAEHVIDALRAEESNLRQE